MYIPRKQALNLDTVLYYRTNYSRCSDGSIRLQNGISPYEGRVEICILGTWVTVCDDFWTINEARVMCTQLGYPCPSQGA